MRQSFGGAQRFSGSEAGMHGRSYRIGVLSRVGIHEIFGRHGKRDPTGAPFTIIKRRARASRLNLYPITDAARREDFCGSLPENSGQSCVPLFKLPVGDRPFCFGTIAKLVAGGREYMYNLCTLFFR